MKTLLLLRHAKSSWDDPTVSDHDRPLNARGLRDAPKVGGLIKQHGLTPDLIIASTAARAQVTARQVALHCDYRGAIDTSSSLYQAPPDEYRQYLRSLPDEYAAVMMVGHNPGLEDLLEQLTGSYEKMPTAALAHISLEIAGWREFVAGTRGQLIRLWRPKDLPS
ncbi:MAG: histidine phosphatase family protein [Pirellulaceae bacterium]|nr:histidine phosphatase family protein [Pirellulaceae bacterium]